MDEDDSSNHSDNYFSKLKLLYFFLVQYIVPDNASPSSSSALHCILRHAKRIEGVQATGCATFDDGALKDIMDNANPMRSLRRFVMTDASVPQNSSNEEEEAGSEMRPSALPLTSASVLRLFDRCPNLQCVGDLRHWDISPPNRRAVARKVQEKTGVKWISTSAH